MIDRIEHIGIAVESIGVMRDFYETLGLQITAIEEIPGEGVRVALIPCGDTMIELLEATGDESPIAKFIARRGPGVHHICLRSDDVRAESEKLRAAGFDVLRAEPSRGAGGCWVQFVHPRSAGGVLVELSEPAGD